MNIPGFNAELSISPISCEYHETDRSGGLAKEARKQVIPQFGIQSDPDLGAYWRCRFNGGSELICRFFGGLPSFSIGGVLLNR
jgi:hypothetical protein